MTKEDILKVLGYGVKELLEVGFTMSELVENDIVSVEYYPPSDSNEYRDEHGNYYNRMGQRLRNPSEYDPRSEGYTPFGDE